MRVATARVPRSLLKARSTALRRLYASRSNAGGRPPLLPRPRRPAIWLAGSGIVVLIPLLRRDVVILRVDYALSAMTRPGLFRGRPRPDRRTRTSFMTAVNASESWR